MADFLNVKQFCWLSFSALCFIVSLNGDRITDKIYQKIDGGFSCFRRLNGTHQIGCTSPKSGSVGVIHFTKTVDDIAWLIEVGPHAPYVVLLSPDLFRRNNVEKLRDSGKLAGIVVLNQTDGIHSNAPTSSYSNDLTCPNKFTGLYKESYSSYCDANPWNPGGDGLLFEDIEFPIFFINETKLNNSVLLDDCFFKFNKPINGTPPSYPLCAIELKAFMWAAVDTPTCIRRGYLNTILNPQPSEFCDPLGSANVFLPLLAANKSDGPVGERSVVFVSARMDSASLFDGLAVGADTAITGMVTLIAIAEMLNRVKTSLLQEDIDNVVLVLFNGESFDYIGSSRMAYDMKLGNFPRPLKNDTPSQGPLIKLENIKYWIELGSLAPQDSQTVFVHTDPISRNNSRVDNTVKELIKALKNNQNDIFVQSTDASMPLPPASLQSFLKQDLNIPGLLISNHERGFTNRYYNNEWDNFQSINSAKLSKHLAGIARTVSASIYELATGELMPITMKANVTLIQEALECYLVNANCSLFNWLLNGKSGLAAEGILSTYVGVSHGDDAFKPLIVRTRHLLALVSGQPLELNRSACVGSENDEINHYYWMGEFESHNDSGTCFKSSVKTSSAISPAFVIDDYNWTSGEYSTWSESRWETFSVRIFLKASSTQEVSVFVFGVIILLLSFIITFWMEENSNLLFPASVDEVAC